MIQSPLLLFVLQVLFLASVAIGGFITTMPDLHRFVVTVHGWLSDEAFVTLFALAQAAPGPNMIVVTLIGWEVAGPLGALFGTLAACLPTLVTAYAVSHFWSSYNQTGWYRLIERAIAPFAVGLVLATGVLLAQGAAIKPSAYVLTAGTVVFMLVSRRSPLIPLAIAAVIGLIGI